MSQKSLQKPGFLQNPDDLLSELKSEKRYKGEMRGKLRYTVKQVVEVFRHLKLKVHEFDCFGIGYLNFKFGEDIIESMRSVIRTYNDKGLQAFKIHVHKEIKKLGDKKLLLEKELRLMNERMKSMDPEELRSIYVSQVCDTISLLKARFSNFMKYITAISRVHGDINCILGISVEVVIIKQKYNNASIALMAQKQALMECHANSIKSFIKNDIDETIGSLVLQCHSMLGYVVKIINETKDFSKERNKAANPDMCDSQADSASLNEFEIRSEIEHFNIVQDPVLSVPIKTEGDNNKPKKPCKVGDSTSANPHGTPLLPLVNGKDVLLQQVSHSIDASPAMPVAGSDQGISTDPTSFGDMGNDFLISMIHKELSESDDQEKLSKVLKVELGELLNGSSLCQDGRTRIEYEITKIENAEKQGDSNIVNKQREALLNELQMVYQIRKMELELKLKDPMISEDERTSFMHELKKINLLIEVNKMHSTCDCKKPELKSPYDYGKLGKHCPLNNIGNEKLKGNSDCELDAKKPLFEDPNCSKDKINIAHNADILSDVRKFLQFNGVCFNK